MDDTPNESAETNEGTNPGRQLALLGASKGGAARAKSMTPEERSASARRAVEARWAKAGKLKDRTYHATHGSEDHPLRIGTIAIPCFVLEDGRRILAQRGLQFGLAMNPSGGAQRMLNLVQSIARSPEELRDLTERIINPIKFQPPWGGTLAHGYEATILADLCDMILEARTAGRLSHNQRKTAERCEILVRGFARVGIIALIDEATGYQADRARDALAKILEAFIAKELRPYIRTFEAEFYQELFRLRGIEFKGTLKAPRYIGGLTNDLVYDRLAPGVREELNRINPTNEKGQRKHKNFQWLSQQVGYQKLKQHLAAVTVLMKVNNNWDAFKKHLDKALPPQRALPLFDPKDTDVAVEAS